MVGVEALDHGDMGGRDNLKAYKGGCLAARAGGQGKATSAPERSRTGRLWQLTVIINILVLALLLAPTLAAAQAPNALLLQGVEEYRLADFQKARETFQEVLSTGTASAAQLAQAHAYLGLIYLALDQPGQAQASFGRVKAVDPGYRPDPAIFPPVALDLFQNAVASQAAPDAPPPADGYVVEVGDGEVTIDMGRARGAVKGERFRVEALRKLKHPVTGRELTKRERVGMIQVAKVQDEVSTAWIIEGGPGIERGNMIFRLAAKAPPAGLTGMDIPKSPESSAAPAKQAEPSPEAIPAEPQVAATEPPAAVAEPPAAPAEPKPEPKPEPEPKPKSKPRGLSIAVLPPILDLAQAPIPLGPDDFSPAKVGRLLSRIKGVKAWGVSNRKLGRVTAKTGFKPEDFLLKGGAHLESLFEAVSRGGDKDALEFDGLSTGQAKQLRRAIDQLGAGSVLIWSVESDGGDMLTIRVNLHKRNSKQPLARGTVSLFSNSLLEKYPAAIAKLVAGELGGKR